MEDPGVPVLPLIVRLGQILTGKQHGVVEAYSVLLDFRGGKDATWMSDDVPPLSRWDREAAYLDLAQYQGCHAAQRLQDLVLAFEKCVLYPLSPLKGQPSRPRGCPLTEHSAVLQLLFELRGTCPNKAGSHLRHEGGAIGPKQDHRGPQGAFSGHWKIPYPEVYEAPWGSRWPARLDELHAATRWHFEDRDDVIKDQDSLTDHLAQCVMRASQQLPCLEGGLDTLPEGEDLHPPGSPGEMWSDWSSGYASLYSLPSQMSSKPKPSTLTGKVLGGCEGPSQTRHLPVFSAPGALGHDSSEPPGVVGTFLQHLNSLSMMNHPGAEDLYGLRLIPGNDPDSCRSPGLHGERELVQLAGMALQGSLSAMELLSCPSLQCGLARRTSQARVIRKVMVMAEQRLRLEVFLAAHGYLSAPHCTEHPGSGGPPCLDSLALDHEVVRAFCTAVQQVLRLHSQAVQALLTSPQGPKIDRESASLPGSIMPDGVSQWGKLDYRNGPGRVKEELDGQTRSKDVDQSGQGIEITPAMPLTLLDLQIQCTSMEQQLQLLAGICYCHAATSRLPANSQGTSTSRGVIAVPTEVQRRCERIQCWMSRQVLPPSEWERPSTSPSITGCHLLTRLYDRLVGAEDDASATMVRYVFSGTMSPLLGRLRQWVGQQGLSADLTPYQPWLGSPPPRGAHHSNCGALTDPGWGSSCLRRLAEVLPWFLQPIAYPLVVLTAEMEVLRSQQARMGDVARYVHQSWLGDSKEAAMVTSAAGEEEVPSSSLGWGGICSLLDHLPTTATAEQLRQVSDIFAAGSRRREAEVDQLLTRLGRLKLQAAKAQDMEVLRLQREREAEREAMRQVKAQQQVDRRLRMARVLQEQKSAMEESQARHQAARAERIAAEQAVLTMAVLRDHARAVADLAREVDLMQGPRRDREADLKRLAWRASRVRLNSLRTSYWEGIRVLEEWELAGEQMGPWGSGKVEGPQEEPGGHGSDLPGDTGPAPRTVPAADPAGEGSVVEDNSRGSPGVEQQDQKQVLGKSRCTNTSGGVDTSVHLPALEVNPNKGPHEGDSPSGSFKPRSLISHSASMRELPDVGAGDKDVQHSFPATSGNAAPDPPQRDHAEGSGGGLTEMGFMGTFGYERLGPPAQSVDDRRLADTPRHEGVPLTKEMFSGTQAEGSKYPSSLLGPLATRAAPVAPISAVLDVYVLQPVILQYRTLTRATWRLLVDHCGLKELCDVIKTYYFLGTGDLAVALAEGLQDPRWSTSTDLSSLLDLCIHQSSCARDPVARQMTLRTPLKASGGTDPTPSFYRHLQLHYSIPSPLTAVVPQDSLAQYSEVFSFLLHLHGTLTLMNQSWNRMRQLGPKARGPRMGRVGQGRGASAVSPNHPYTSPHVHRRLKQLATWSHWGHHALSSILAYLHAQLQGRLLLNFWKRMSGRPLDLLEMRQCHDQFLEEAMEVCLGYPPAAEKSGRGDRHCQDTAGAIKDVDLHCRAFVAATGLAPRGSSIGGDATSLLITLSNETAWQRIVAAGGNLQGAVQSLKATLHHAALVGHQVADLYYRL